MAFGFEKIATFEQVAKVLSAFDYDGIEVGASSTTSRSSASRTRRVERSSSGGSTTISASRSPASPPAPTATSFRLPWATGSQDVYDEYLKFFES